MNKYEKRWRLFGDLPKKAWILAQNQRFLFSERVPDSPLKKNFDF